MTLSGQKGSGGSSGTGGKASKGSGSKSGATSTPAPPPTCTKLAALCSTFGVIAPGAPGNPAVTINDIRNFPAQPGTDHMEPNGWMIVGLATNFYSVVGVQVVDGTLLGQPASVRFTPISWHWTYGDGASAVRGTPGSTWAAQSIAEFDPTPTSHTYARAGSYTIDLDITFRAEYRYASGGWRPSWVPSRCRRTPCTPPRVTRRRFS